jgi:hypothetical protein
VPAEPVDDYSGEREADTAADAERGADQPDRGRHALGRELVSDDPEPERECTRGDPLDRAGDDQQGDRVGHRGQQRADGQHRQAREQQAALAEHVAELADHGGRDRGREQERTEHPGNAGGRRREVALQGGERRGDHRLQEREPEHGDQQCRERARDAVVGRHGVLSGGAGTRGAAGRHDAAVAVSIAAVSEGSHGFDSSSWGRDRMPSIALLDHVGLVDLPCNEPGAPMTIGIAPCTFWYSTPGNDEVASERSSEQQRHGARPAHRARVGEDASRVLPALVSASEL